MLNKRDACNRIARHACAICWSPGLLISWSVILFLLTSCGAPLPLTFDEARATAHVAGCWPGNGQTPLPVTITASGGVIATPQTGVPTPTTLPTSSAYPRCTPEPEAPTLQPYPTPGPTHAPFPTRAPFTATGTEQANTVFHLSETILQIDVAAHPSENWPAVIAVAAPLIADDENRVFVRVFNPRAGRWSSAQSLGSGARGLLRTRFRTAQIGIAGDGSVIAVWGIVGNPRFGVLASISRDYGETWRAPEALAERTFGVRDMAVTPDGKVAVLAISEIHQRPILIRRSAAGQWQQPEALPVPAWYGSDGALALVGEGSATRVVIATSGGGGNSPDNKLFLMSRLWEGGDWATEHRMVPSPDQHNADLLTQLTLHPLDAQTLMLSFGMAGRSRIYGLSSTDAGVSWGSLQTIAQLEGKTVPRIALATDAASKQAAVIWTCCADAAFVGAEVSHYTSWGNPATGGWQPVPGTLGTPLITGAIAAADTASAQAPNSSQVWLAWVEQVHQVQVRAFEVARLRPNAGVQP